VNGGKRGAKDSSDPEQRRIAAVNKNYPRKVSATLEVNQRMMLTNKQLLHRGPGRVLGMNSIKAMGKARWGRGKTGNATFSRGEGREGENMHS